MFHRGFSEALRSTDEDLWFLAAKKDEAWIFRVTAWVPSRLKDTFQHTFNHPWSHSRASENLDNITHPSDAIPAKNKKKFDTANKILINLFH